MTDSKNIVIKVKYTPPDGTISSPPSPPKMITEWNVKRIAGALGVFFLIIVSLSFFLSGKSGDTEDAHHVSADSNQTEAAPHDEAKHQDTLSSAASIPGAASETGKSGQSSQTPEPAKAIHTGRIRRAALSYRIIDKEPVDLIGTTVGVKKNKPVLIHYFTEARGKKNQTLFHEWLKDGQIIQRHPVTISAERWRASSQRQLSIDDQGHWSVRTVDGEGGVMNEMQFNVSAK